MRYQSMNYTRQSDLRKNNYALGLVGDLMINLELFKVNPNFTRSTKS